MNIIALLKKWESFVGYKGENGVMEVKLNDISQLCNSMDPSPFYEKDLDADAEAFIESWAFEYQLGTPLTLVVYLEKKPEMPDAGNFIRSLVHNYFAYKAELTERELKQLLREGRTSLLIGLAVLSVFFGISDILGKASEQSAILELLKESFLIGGWVAMWHPIQIFLYNWWPILRKARIYAKMSQMEVLMEVSGKPEEESARKKDTIRQKRIHDSKQSPSAK